MHQDMLLRSTLLAEGPTDAVLCHHLTWLLTKLAQQAIVETTRFVQAEIMRDIPRQDLAKRMHRAVARYPCELLFIHRDADARDAVPRRAEIEHAYRTVAGDVPVVVAVVPIYATEAWLLFDSMAIRSAADNVNGNMPLLLPPLKRVEQESQPKVVLRDLIKTASGSSGRHLDRFMSRYTEHLTHLVEAIEDFSPLLKFSAFRQLHDDIAQIVGQNGW